MIQAVLFDMDGTVFDTETIYRDCFYAEAERLHVPGNYKQDLPCVMGMNDAKLFAFFHDKYDETYPIEELMKNCKIESVKKIDRDGMPLKPGVPAVFDELHKRHIRLGIVSSSKWDAVEHYMEVSGLKETFDVFVTGDDVKHSKPAPDPYLTAAKKLGVNPADCVVVEDAVNGCLSGLAAGMRTVMVPDLLPCPDDLRPKLWHVATTLFDLVGYIDEIS